MLKATSAGLSKLGQHHWPRAGLEKTGNFTHPSTTGSCGFLTMMEKLLCRMTTLMTAREGASRRPERGQGPIFSPPEAEILFPTEFIYPLQWGNRDFERSQELSGF